MVVLVVVAVVVVVIVIYTYYKYFFNITFIVYIMYFQVIFLTTVIKQTDSKMKNVCVILSLITTGMIVYIIISPPPLPMSILNKI